MATSNNGGTTVGKPSESQIGHCLTFLDVVVTRDDEECFGVRHDHELTQEARELLTRSDGAVLVTFARDESVRQVHFNTVAGVGAWQVLVEAREALDVAIAAAERMDRAFEGWTGRTA